jgi:hypothetical protein
VAFSADGALLARTERITFDSDGQLIGTFDARIGFYEVQTKKRIAEQKPGARVAMTFALKGQAFAAVDAGSFHAPGGMRVWEKPNAKGAVHLKWPAPVRRGDPFSSATAFSPDHKLLAAGWNGGNVQVWNIAGVWEKKEPPLKPVSEWKGDGKPVRSLAFDPRGKSVVVGCTDGSVTVWDVASAKPLARFPAPKAPPEKGAGDRHDTPWCSAGCFSADGRKVAVVDLRGLRLLEVASQKEIAHVLWEKKPTFEQRAFCAGFSADRNRMAVGFANGNIKLWDLAAFWKHGRAPTLEGAIIQGGEFPWPVYAVVFSPDARLLGGYLGDQLKVWEFVPGPKSD